MLFCAPFCLFVRLGKPFFYLWGVVFGLHILKKVHFATFDLAIHS